MVVKVNIPNVCFLATAVFGLDQLHFIKMLDELLDIFPAGLFYVVEMCLLCRVDRKIGRNHVRDQHGRRYWQSKVVIGGVGIVLFEFVEGENESLDESIVNFCIILALQDVVNVASTK